MKILGADGLVNGVDSAGINALDMIPSIHLSHGDCACAKHDNKFYWYILEDGDSSPANSPNIVAPSDGGTKRWHLRNIYLTALEVESIITESIYAPSGMTLDLNGSMELSGNTVIFQSDNPPFVVPENSVMIENLNAEYWGGMHWTEFDIDNLLWSGDAWIPKNTETIYVQFPAPRANTTYALFTEMVNVVTSSPALFNHIVTEKTLIGFTVKLSAKTDNAYYRLQWAVLGENEEFESYNLLDTNYNPLQDVLGNQITVM